MIISLISSSCSWIIHTAKNYSAHIVRKSKHILDDNDDNYDRTRCCIIVISYPPGYVSIVVRSQRRRNVPSYPQSDLRVHVRAIKGRNTIDVVPREQYGAPFPLRPLNRHGTSHKNTIRGAAGIGKVKKKSLGVLLTV